MNLRRAFVFDFVSESSVGFRSHEKERGTVPMDLRRTCRCCSYWGQLRMMWSMVSGLPQRQLGEDVRLNRCSFAWDGKLRVLIWASKMSSSLDKAWSYVSRDKGSCLAASRCLKFSEYFEFSHSAADFRWRSLLIHFLMSSGAILFHIILELTAFFASWSTFSFWGMPT